MSEAPTKLITSSDYANALDAFVMEMSGVIVAKAESTLAASSELRSEFLESLELLRDPRTTPEAALALAWGMVDEFVHAQWDHVIAESYALYLDMNGGRSHRHPTSLSDPMDQS
jgi:hypothetical protein